MWDHKESTMSGYARVAAVLLVLGCAVVLGGCQNMVPLTHSGLKAVDHPANLTIQVDNLAANARKERPNCIGSHSCTVFAIRSGDINVEKPLHEILHPFIEDALRQAGYTPVDVRGKKAADAPVLRGEIRNFWFAGYSWTWPAYVQGGNIQYRLILQKPDGTTLWEKLFKVDEIGAAVVVDSGYDKLACSATTKLLDQVAAAVVADDFKAALQKH